jgi:hypothetical protein
MITELLKVVLPSAMISTILVSLLIWLTKSWLATWIRNAIKYEYDQKLESHRAQLKAESDVMLERLRADLSIAAAERQIIFNRLHERRAKVIAKTYAQLKQLYIALSEYVKIFEPAGGPPKEDRRKNVANAHKDFFDYFSKKQIFLPESVVDKIDNINRKSISTFYDFYYSVDMDDGRQPDSIIKWNKIFAEVRDQIPITLKELESDFRKLLGDES